MVIPNRAIVSATAPGSGMVPSEGATAHSRARPKPKSHTSHWGVTGQRRLRGFVPICLSGDCAPHSPHRSTAFSCAPGENTPCRIYIREFPLVGVLEDILTMSGVERFFIAVAVIGFAGLFGS
jgi:hypothetical protein